MEKQIIQEELKNCPRVCYYPDSNKLELVGRLIPENPELILGRIENWINSHFEKNNALNVSIQLEYINSRSSKYLFEILNQLKSYINSGKSIDIKWLYEEDDETVLELGEHFRDTIGVPFKIEMVL